MAYVFCNPNPDGKLVDDCVIRGLSIVLDMDWDTVAVKLCTYEIQMHDMQNSNSVWAKMLEDNGFKRYIIPDTCPDCYTVRRFTQDYPVGTYLLATGTHVVAVKDGNYLDTFDSGDYVPVYFYQKER